MWIYIGMHWFQISGISVYLAITTKYLEYLFIWPWLLNTWNTWNIKTSLSYFWYTFCGHYEIRIHLIQSLNFVLQCLLKDCCFTCTALSQRVEPTPSFFNGYFGTMAAGSSRSLLTWISWSSTTVEERCHQTQTWSSRHRRVILYFTCNLEEVPVLCPFV